MPPNIAISSVAAQGHETVPASRNRRSEIEGRRRNLQLTERYLVGPMLASFIAVLSIRFRLSRQKIQEFLADWLGLSWDPPASTAAFESGPGLRAAWSRT